ncbi:MAG: protein kinase [Oligoflexia bacterium]|nr:protein kinase [Oligoflexia bacterium]
MKDSLLIFSLFVITFTTSLFFPFLKIYASEQTSGPNTGMDRIEAINDMVNLNTHVRESLSSHPQCDSASATVPSTAPSSNLWKECLKNKLHDTLHFDSPALESEFFNNLANTSENVLKNLFVEEFRSTITFHYAKNDTPIGGNRIFEFSGLPLPVGKYNYTLTEDGKVTLGLVSNALEIGAKHIHLANGRRVLIAGELQSYADGRIQFNVESGSFSKEIASTICNRIVPKPSDCNSRTAIAPINSILRSCVKDIIFPNNSQETSRIIHNSKITSELIELVCKENRSKYEEECKSLDAKKIEKEQFADQITKWLSTPIKINKQACEKSTCIQTSASERPEAIRAFQENPCEGDYPCSLIIDTSEVPKNIELMVYTKAGEQPQSYRINTDSDENKNKYNEISTNIFAATDPDQDRDDQEESMKGVCSSVVSLIEKNNNIMDFGNGRIAIRQDDGTALVVNRNDVQLGVGSFKVVRKREIARLSRENSVTLTDAAIAFPKIEHNVQIDSGGKQLANEYKISRLVQESLSRSRSPSYVIPFEQYTDQTGAKVLSSPIYSSNLQDAFETQDMPTKIALITDAARGTSQLHQLGIAHSDIKPGNILIDLEKTPAKAIVADLGEAGSVKKLRAGDNIKITGTLGYMAPEIIEQRALAGKKNLARDIFSLGMTMVSSSLDWKDWNPSSRKCETTKPPPSSAPPLIIENGTPAIEIQCYKDNVRALIAEIQSKYSTDDTPKGKILRLAAECINVNPTQRPEISTVLERLESPNMATSVRQYSSPASEYRPTHGGYPGHE